MAVIRATRPSFRNKHDKVAFAVHATFLASGYVLTASGPTAYEDDALTSSSTGTSNPLYILASTVNIALNISPGASSL